MTTLHDRLADLADEATGAPPSVGLWGRGRRLHRRRRAGTAAIVTVAVVLMVGLVELDRSRDSVDIEPAGPETEVGLPDRLYAPDPHLPGTADTSPIGPLSVAFPAIRETWAGDSSNGLVGVSATGEYAYLDIPGLGTSTYSYPGSYALSADGTRIAYWLTGDPAGEPGGEPQQEPYVGVAVYDTVTGEVERLPVETEHGLAPESLVWAADTLWFEVWQYEPPDGDGWGSTLTSVMTWDPDSGREVVLDDDGAPLSAYLRHVSAYETDLVKVDSAARLRRTGPDGEETAERRQLASTPQGPVFVSPGGTSLAGLRDTEGDGAASNLPEPVVVGSLAASDPVVLTDVPDAATRRLEVILGWRDETHVVGLRNTGRESFRGVVSIDVRNGELERLLPLTPGVGTFVVAEDALAGPTFDAPKPPRPLDPRRIYGGAAAILLGAGLALLWWRRHVQR